MAREQILVVDDEAEQRRFIRSVLVPLGYRVREAAGGREALEEIGAEKPDLILLDLSMPGLDGYAVCRAIKGDPRTRLIPVIIVTAMDALPEKIRAIEIGADDFLSKPVHLAELRTRVRSLLSLKSFTDEMEHVSGVLQTVARIVDGRDAYTAEHGRRVSESAVRLGRALAVGEPELEQLRLGALLHDIGKVAVPDAILLKPGLLSDGETAVMRGHPVRGWEILRPMKTLEKMIHLVRHHHEKLDGSGYPDQLEAREIGLTVRILSVVDVYDALTTPRVYRDAFPSARALAILQEEVARGWWDGDVVETWSRLVSGGAQGLDAPGRIETADPHRSTPAPPTPPPEPFRMPRPIPARLP